VSHGDSSDSKQIVKIVEILQRKWTIHVLWEMRKGPVRFGQFRRSIPHASKKGLTSSLRALENAEIIIRRDLSDSVLHVEYEIAESLRKPLADLLAYLATSASLLPRGRSTAVPCDRSAE